MGSLRMFKPCASALLCVPDLGTYDTASNLQIRALWGKMLAVLSWKHGLLKKTLNLIQAGILSLARLQHPMKIQVFFLGVAI